MSDTPQSRGGKARAAALTPEERTAIASGAALARWTGSGEAKPRTMRAIIKDLRRHKEAISKHRDALRAILDDIEAITDSAERADDDLQRAIYALSEYL